MMKKFLALLVGVLLCGVSLYGQTNRANFGANIRTSTFQQPLGFITASGVIVPHTFAGEFGARFSF